MPIRRRPTATNTQLRAESRLSAIRAVELRATGLTFSQIATTIKAEGGTLTSFDGVRDAISRELRKPPPGAEELRALSNIRLDSQLRRLLPQLERATARGDEDLALKVEDRVLRNEIHRMRINGLQILNLKMEEVTRDGLAANLGAYLDGVRAGAHPAGHLGAAES